MRIPSDVMRGEVVRRWTAAALVALAVLAVLAGCSDGGDDVAEGDSTGTVAGAPDDSVPPSDEGGRDLVTASLRFAQCLRDEGLAVPEVGSGIGSRLEALRELDPGDGEVVAAVQACFPALAAEFQAQGLRPPTKGAAVEGDAGVGLAEPGAPYYEGDFADPFLLESGDGRFVYATNTLFQNVPAAAVPDGGGELEVVEALPDLPAWTESGAVWAPAVAETDDGYVLYFTSRHRVSGRQCIGVATSDAPAGPFVATSDEPWICPLDLGGAIDASAVVDGDRRYVLWKGDGNCCGIPTSLFVQETDATGTQLTGDPVELLGVDQGWEGELVEGPAMVEADGRWLLFYSANRWDTDAYAIGVAECETVTGPCTKPQEVPWLSTYETAAGPGGQELSIDAEGESHVVYHAWDPAQVGYDAGGSRRLYFEPVDLAAELPALTDR